jgi:MFS family permease
LPTVNPRTRVRSWSAVGAAAVVLAIGNGCGFYALSAYASALVSIRRFDLTDMSTAATLLVVSAGLISTALPWLLDRVSPHIVMISGAVMLGAGLSVIGIVDHRWQLFTVYIWCGVGSSLISVITTTHVIIRWFPAKPVRPLALANTGLSVGGAVLAPVVAGLIGSNGIDVVMPWLGAVAAVVTSIAIALFLRVPRDSARTEPRTMANEERVRRLFTRTYLTICAAFLLLILTQISMISHLLTIADERHIEDAPTALIVIAFASLVGRFATLPFLGRFRALSIAAGVALVQAAGVLMCALAQSSSGLLAASALIGIAVGNNLALLPTCLLEVYGATGLTRRFAWATLITFVGGGAGPALLGLGASAWGGYRTPIVIIACCSAIASLILLGLRFRTVRAPSSPESVEPARGGDEALHQGSRPEHRAR